MLPAPVGLCGRMVLETIGKPMPGWLGDGDLLPQRG
eukprot:COSAG01_NODE_44999_length_413_cov_3.095541_1_plen_35_part_01